MKFVDMFCGMGTIRMGFEQAGHECVYSVEWDKHKRKIYEVIFGHEPEGCDITRVRAADIPPADCWCFGAPCQDFSVAGLRAGLDGERSGLVREVFRLVREKEPDDRPEWLLYENVKGLLSSNIGWDFAAIQVEMGELGYDVQWQLLNSKDFGVPQNRERVYTLGHLRAYGRREVFPIVREIRTVINNSEYQQLGKLDKPYIDGSFTSMKGYDTSVRDIGSEIAGTITKRYYKGIGANGDNVVVQFSDGSGIAHCLDANYYKCILAHQKRTGVIQVGNVMPTATRENPNQGMVYDPVGLAPCLDKMEGGGREPMIIEPCACLTPDRPEKRQNGRRFKEPNEPMFTLTKQDVHGVLVVDDDILEKYEQEDCAERNNLDEGLQQDNETYATKILLELRKAVGEEAFAKWGFAILDAFQQAEVLQSNVYEETLDDDENEVTKDATWFKGKCSQIFGNVFRELSMPDVREIRKNRYASQGREPNEQRSGELDDIVQKLSYEIASPEIFMQDLWKAGEGVRILREALSKIQKIWKPICGKNQSTLQYRIRRLSPRECFRLQGIPDYITDKLIAAGISDTQMYRAAGDACTVNVIYEIARRLWPASSPCERSAQ